MSDRPSRHIRQSTLSHWSDQLTSWLTALARNTAMTTKTERPAAKRSLLVLPETENVFIFYIISMTTFFFLVVLEVFI